MKDLVSICIPTYNGEQFIAEAMTSAVNQTYPNLEIVVSDDASKDNTLNIIESFKDKTQIPIYIFKHQPKGIGANWNNCIKKAKGKYIKFLFQDDVLLPNCIEGMLVILNSQKSIAILSCKRQFLIEDSFKTDNYKKWVETYKNLQINLGLEYNNSIAFIDKKLFKHPTFFKSPLNKIGEPSTLLFRKELINEIGYFNEELEQVLDYEFCYRVLPFSKIGIVDKTLVQFRLHGGQATVKNKEGNLYTKDFIAFEKILYKKYLKYFRIEEVKKLSRKYNPTVKFIFNSIDGLKRFSNLFST